MNQRSTLLAWVLDRSWILRQTLAAVESYDTYGSIDSPWAGNSDTMEFIGFRRVHTSQPSSLTFPLRLNQPLLQSYMTWRIRELFTGMRLISVLEGKLFPGTVGVLSLFVYTQ